MNMIKTFMYLWFNYCVKNNPIQRTPDAEKNIDHLFRMAIEIIESDKLYLFLLSDSTRIDDNKYLRQGYTVKLFFQRIS